MKYIHIKDGVPLRDARGNGHLHAVIGFCPDGSIVEQSKDHGQIMQRLFLPNGKLVISRFAEAGGEIRALDETTICLRDGEAGGSDA